MPHRRNGQAFVKKHLSFNAIHESIFQLVQQYADLEDFNVQEVQNLWEEDSSDVPGHCQLWNSSDTDEVVKTVKRQALKSANTWDLQSIKFVIIKKYIDCIYKAGIGSPRPGMKQLSTRIKQLKDLMQTALENEAQHRATMLADRVLELKGRLRAIKDGFYDGMWLTSCTSTLHSRSIDDSPIIVTNLASLKQGISTGCPHPEMFNIPPH